MALVVGGVVAMALGGLMLAGSAGQREDDVVDGVPVQVLDRVIARVSKHEGTFDSLNLNRDGAGLSVGILPWSQRPLHLPRGTH
mgnify:FL=1